MSYPAGETLILARLQAISGSVWTTANTSQAKWKILNSGVADHYAILKEGAGGTSASVSFSVEERRYSTIIQVWQSYKDDGTSATNLQAYGEAISDQFARYRKLGDSTGGVRDAYCSAWSEVTEQWRKGENGPRWLRQDFTITWVEEEAVSYAE